MWNNLTLLVLGFLTELTELTKVSWHHLCPGLTQRTWLRVVGSVNEAVKTLAIETGIASESELKLHIRRFKVNTVSTR